MNDMNMDQRLNAALEQDAKRVAPISADVPAALRARIASTPAKTALSSAGAASSAAVTTSFTTKLTLAIIGCIAGIVIGYFAFTSREVAVEAQPSPMPQEQSVITIDTPQPVRDSMQTTVKRSTTATNVTKQPAEQPSVTNEDLKKMLDKLEPSKTTIREADSTRGVIGRKK
jgi:hypothetical protein